MAVDLTSRRPAYEQIADELRRRINFGEVAAGAKLPTEVESRRSRSRLLSVPGNSIGDLRASSM